MSNLLLQNILSLNDTQLKDWAENKFSITSLHGLYFPDRELDFLNWLKKQPIYDIQVRNTTENLFGIYNQDLPSYDRYQIQNISFTAHYLGDLDILRNHPSITYFEISPNLYMENSIDVSIVYTGNLNLAKELFNV